MPFNFASNKALSVKSIIKIQRCGIITNEKNYLDNWMWIFYTDHHTAISNEPNSLRIALIIRLQRDPVWHTVYCEPILKREKKPLKQPSKKKDGIPVMYKYIHFIINNLYSHINKTNLVTSIHNFGLTVIAYIYHVLIINIKIVTNLFYTTLFMILKSFSYHSNV